MAEEDGGGQPLRRAHQALDRAVDRLYRPAGFASERERVEHLFTLYEKMRSPLGAVMKAKPKRRRAKGKSTGAVRRCDFANYFAIGAVPSPRSTDPGSKSAIFMRALPMIFLKKEFGFYPQPLQIKAGPVTVSPLPDLERTASDVLASDGVEDI